MADAPICERLPDARLRLLDGGAANLGHFCGQKLVVFFCAAGGPQAAAAEIEAYRALAGQFQDAGAWMIGVIASAADAPEDSAGPHINLGLDPDGAAFRALIGHFPHLLEASPADGIAFVIDRDGSVRHAFPGPGRARDTLEGVRERP